MPIRAAGVSPYALSALKRPPTFGSAFSTLKLLSLALISSGESGSVITTK